MRAASFSWRQLTSRPHTAPSRPGRDHPGLRIEPAEGRRDEPVTLPDPLPTTPAARARLEQQLRNALKLEAPLAVQGQPGHAGFFPFNKFSTVPLLIKAAREAFTESGGDDVKKRLMIVPRCHVIRLNSVTEAGGRRVTEVITERGPVPVVPGAQMIVALGTVESTRLALLSFGDDGRIGANLMRSEERRVGKECRL